MATAIAAGLPLALGVVPAVHAAGPTLLFSGPQEVAEGGSGVASVVYAVNVFFDYPLIACPFDNPDCNVKVVPVSVDFSVAGDTATANADFQGAGSGTLSDTLVFQQPDLQPLGTIEVQVVGDTVDEDDETFGVHLSNAQGANFDGASAVTTTIVDDDGTQVPPNFLSINDVTIREGDAAARTVVFSVTLSVPAAQVVTVGARSVDGTARSLPSLPLRGADYRRVPRRMLTFAVGETSRTIEVEVFGDRAVERSETFTIELSNPINAALADGVGLATIVNED